jgi:C-terminal processing protease CtpA/Prc
LEDDINSRRCSSQTAKATAFAAGNHASINISEGESTASDVQGTEQPSQRLESDEDSGSEDGDSGPLDDTQPFTGHVVLQRGQKGFGFNIKKSMGAGPLLVGKIAPDGVASNHPELQPGARIVAINGHDTTSISRGEIRC